MLKNQHQQTNVTYKKKTRVVAFAGYVTREHKPATKPLQKAQKQKTAKPC